MGFPLGQDIQQLGTHYLREHLFWKDKGQENLVILVLTVVRNYKSVGFLEKGRQQI